jgi:phosphatidylserine synthase
VQTPKQGIYWLPNMLTTAALFCGFYAIIAEIQVRQHQVLLPGVFTVLGTHTVVVRGKQD